MKSCRLCRPAVEIAAEALLSHLLRGHPAAQVLAIAGLSVGSVYLVDRPEYLVALYAAMFAGAWMFRSDVVS